MSLPLIGALKRRLGLVPPGRNVAVWPDDTFLVSYPKSGNTWSRFLVANLLHPERAAEFASINDVIPGIDVVSKTALGRMPRPRILKSHQYFDPRYPRVIYIVRDPRDVAVSQFHFHRKRRVVGDDCSMDTFVAGFVEPGAASSYSSWGEHVGSWLAARCGQPRFLLLRYEDMIANTSRELAKIAGFLELSATPELLAQAVERSSADRMRKLEKAQAQTFASTRNTRQDIAFVRTAGSGGWRSELPVASVIEIEKAWGGLMSWLGYPPVHYKTAMADADLFHSLLRERVS